MLVNKNRVEVSPCILLEKLQDNFLESSNGNPFGIIYCNPLLLLNMGGWSAFTLKHFWCPLFLHACDDTYLPTFSRTYMLIQTNIWWIYSNSGRHVYCHIDYGSKSSFRCSLVSNMAFKVYMQTWLYNNTIRTNHASYMLKLHFMTSIQESRIIDYYLD